ncbi:cell surface protein [Levilactobacillus suantsaiihabitans]|uniref:Cell surface protein n=2 Tax=Lactobacillaceae TaxID=33958 RepID=A0A4Z0JBI5_9LACO|nr:cell surface protein [Levilactobacillus suantsaiihabitans]
MNIKKIINRAGSSLAVIALALGLSPMVANAAGPGTESSNLTTVSTGYAATATSNAEAMSNAQFSVTGGMLTLNAVPNVLLSSTTVNDLQQTTQTLKMASGSTTVGTGYDGNNNGNLNVSDYRGTHAGWSLTVGMGPFTLLSGSASAITNSSLNLFFTQGASDNTETPAPNAVALPQGTVTNDWIANPETVWNAPAQTGEGSNTATLNSDETDLQIGKQSNVSAGTYDSTLYWALQDAPTATTAA